MNKVKCKEMAIYLFNLKRMRENKHLMQQKSYL